MLTKLALLSIALAHPQAASLDASGAVDDALTAAGQTDCGGTPCATILVGWSFWESGWGKATLGDCLDPKHRTLTTCAAFGAMNMKKGAGLAASSLMKRTARSASTSVE